MLAKCWPCFYLSLYTLFWTFVRVMFFQLCACTYVNGFCMVFVVSVQYSTIDPTFYSCIFVIISINSWGFLSKWEEMEIKMDHDLLFYMLVLRCFLHECVCLYTVCKDKYRWICLSGGSIQSGMTVEWNITSQQAITVISQSRLTIDPI